MEVIEIVTGFVGIGHADYVLESFFRGESMIDKLKLGALAVACCFVLILVPVLANAQVGGAIQKGVQGVEKGVDTGVEKTKEGAQATKDAITGQDQNQNQNQDQNRMKPEESQTNPSTEQKSNESETEKKNMPRTAGELPLLALAGCLALTAAGLSRVIRRQKNY